MTANTRSRARGFLRGEGAEAERVTYVELFFDLVFAFAITQISGVLGDEPTLLSVLEGVIVTFAVWWIWVYTAWATNWLDPGRRRVLWLLFALTAVGLVISEAIPAAFTTRAAVFAVAYLGYGVIRTLGVIAGTRRDAPEIAGGQARILVWTAVAGVFWIGGVVAESPWVRLGAWAVAIAIEYAGPWALFWIPGRGRSSWSAWRIRAGHFSERAALFIIIVLGESILVVGRGLTTHELSAPVVAAAVAAFVDAVAMWFLYFAHGQDRGRHYFAGRSSPGAVARVSYTYLHVVLVLGLVLSTHGSELALEHPDAAADLVAQALVFGGTALYLAGLVTFKMSIGVRPSWIPAHVAGVGALAALFALGAARAVEPSRLESALLATGVLVLVVVLDEVLWRRRARADAAG
ncbi:low temperature requirement protein A [Herbiconiux daphne]|uniref:Low temperature requirement protein A n=1 Tax=Herbiconiux daphne TaxID=2970914 RepID=A0ABT2H5B2_9MICO|nr:low temperature requirement protein A [Herbiconiux daphne]MCS5735127.1 low temperature requirement protein A [Herbiconiux daphne]